MPKLQEYPAALQMNSVRDIAPTFNLPLGVNSRRYRVSLPRLRNLGGFRDNQSAVRRPLLIMQDVLCVRRDCPILRAHSRERSHNDPMAQSIWPHGQWRKQHWNTHVNSVN